MKVADSVLNIFRAAALLRMSPELLKWFTRYAPKSGEVKKLEYDLDGNGELVFKQGSLWEFNQYLVQPWPCKKGSRPNIPLGIRTEIKSESQFRCILCGHSNAEFAHVDSVHNSMNNHPHNLIYLCPNCHDQYDNKKTINHRDVLAAKNAILTLRGAVWRAQSDLLDGMWALIRQIEHFADGRLAPFYSSLYPLLVEMATNAIREKVASPDKYALDSGLAERLATACNSKDKVSALSDHRQAYVNASGLTDCPLCKGTGSHNNWECPVCRGIGTTSTSILPEIDLSAFEQNECPLCHGSGSHNNWECPVCRGVGTVDNRDIHDIDLSYFEQDECPLCKGSGCHNHYECPICRGVGTVDHRELPEIDISPFQQSQCPLCEGRGSHNRSVCIVCSGSGTVNCRDLPEIDLSFFEQKNCPLCGGSGSHNRYDCPVCRGVGTVDQRDLSDIDLSSFMQIECPLCKGSGSHNRLDCPICSGVGTADNRNLSEIDLSFFEQRECPVCKGSGISRRYECRVCRGIGTVDARDLHQIDPNL